MARFLKGNELNAEIENLFEDAANLIILISPFIKLHDRYLSALKTKKGNPGIRLIVVFGKNEDNLSKSMKIEDVNFFKDFPNVEIRYEKNLHAKYYANESSAILTSMNLYSFSQDNNIEAGVLLKSSNILLGSITGDNALDKEAWSYFDRVIDQAELLYKKEPEYESSLLGLKKNYKTSIVTSDILDNFFSGKPQKPNYKVTYSKKETTNEKIGYCIRTGKKIPFNPNSPLSDEAYQSWLKFNNKDYPEKYCHFSGEESNGDTSYSKPILRKNWNKAKQKFNL